jgi:hypothetical protein
MTLHAADLLEQSLAETKAASGFVSAAAMPPVAEIMSAFDELLARQEDIYDQILLPELGLGERFDVRPHELERDGHTRRYRGGEVWLFDGRPAQNWLHAPLLIPFEDLEDTLIVVRRRDIPPQVAERLRPPLIPGVRRALAGLDWLVVDSGGYEGGRMEHSEFLDEIGDLPWLRVDHDPDTGAARFESWRGEEPRSGWSANIFDAFECSVQPPGAQDAPATLNQPWPVDPDAHPFEIAVALDLLDDPYAICRRLIYKDSGLDIDRLGPLVTWKDSPDVLFEFTDEDDSHLTNLGVWMASKFDGDADDFKIVVDAWFARIRRQMPVEFPGLGTLHEIIVPSLKLLRPRPLLGHVAAPVSILSAERLFAATTQRPEEWSE